jgi:CheY-like chemotaxis protein
MKRVLLIDDDTLLLKMFQDGLARHGFQVETAGDGLQAIRILNISKPDIVVLDLMMPKLSGVDVIRFIRGKPDLAHLPIVVLSNSYVDELAQGAQNAGIQEALLKSRCTPTALVQIIQEILKRAAAGESPAAIPENQTVASSPWGPRLAQEEELQAQHCREFLEKAGENCAVLRSLFEGFRQATDKTSRATPLDAFRRKIHFLSGTAGLTGCHRIGKLCEIIETLLLSLIDKPEQLNASVLKTIAAALDCLEALLHNTNDPAEEPLLNPQILVVDDDPLSTRLEVLALRRAHLHAYGIEDSVAALARLQEASYDLILLDVEMPGLNGFEFCRSVRALPRYQRTPILYVTSHADCNTHAEGLLSGGNDVIHKPIFPTELAVKAVTHLLRAGLPG